MKKEYNKPKMTEYGNVEKITESGGCVTPSDTQNGPDLQAFPLGRVCS